MSLSKGKPFYQNKDPLLPLKSRKHALRGKLSKTACVVSSSKCSKCSKMDYLRNKSFMKDSKTH